MMFHVSGTQGTVLLITPSYVFIGSALTPFSRNANKASDRTRTKHLALSEMKPRVSLTFRFVTKRRSQMRPLLNLLCFPRFACSPLSILALTHFRATASGIENNVKCAEEKLNHIGSGNRHAFNRCSPCLTFLQAKWSSSTFPVNYNWLPRKILFPKWVCLRKPNFYQF